tara:strand:- start:1447 stop:1659 length:213 start_codon:yes stop_codon:yes gene_type:complete
MKNRKKKRKESYKKKENRVYIFNNVLFNFNMYINADTANEACEKFDQCGFAHRNQWKIMVELSHQPSEAA